MHKKVSSSIAGFAGQNLNPGPPEYEAFVCDVK
jgi:hypothetical protein